MTATLPPSLGARLAALWERRETIRYLVVSQLRAGHRTKLLGNLWNLLDPALSLAVYFLIFGYVMRQSAGDPWGYLVYLFIGVLSWRFIDASLGNAANCIRAHRGLIQEIRFPKAVFPLAVCLARFYDLLWGFVVLAIALLVAGIRPDWHIVLVLPLMALHFVLALGLAYAVAYWGAFLSDTANVLTVALRLGFYGSPILYYIDGPNARFPEWLVPWLMLNPVACLLHGYRRVLMDHSVPDPDYTLYLALVTALVALFGFGLFARGEGKFAKYV